MPTINFFMVEDRDDLRKKKVLLLNVFFQKSQAAKITPLWYIWYCWPPLVAIKVAKIKGDRGLPVQVYQVQYLKTNGAITLHSSFRE